MATTTRVSKSTRFSPPCHFPENVIKCEVSRIRAHIHAAETGQAATRSTANDKPGNRDLAEKTNLGEEKEVRLTRDGRDCVDLYRTLSLAEGHPVMLTDHYDRSPGSSC